MELTVCHEDGYFLAKTTGAIDGSADQLFRDQLHPLVARRDTKLILDLSGSATISSLGISRLVLLVTDANTKHSRVIIAAPSRFLGGVFRVSHLDHFFEIADRVDDAVDMLGRSVCSAHPRSE